MIETPQDRRNALLKAVSLLRAKARSNKLAYSCFIEDQPSELVPRSARRQLDFAADDHALIVNPSFRCQTGVDLPGEILDRALVTDCLLPGNAIAWIEDPGTAIWLPFWARDEYAEALSSLRPGVTAPPGLRRELRRGLVLANILVWPGYEEARRAQWRQICRRAQVQFRANGYVVVRDLIHPLHLGAMRRYYRALLASGDLILGDRQVPDRYVLHSEVLASFLHPQLTHLVQQIAGERVKPSYVYFASYRPGAHLPPHTDREQCEFSISLLMDYAPEREGPCGWPILMKDPAAPDVVQAADLAIGDGAFYLGRKLLHYRQALPEGHHSTSVFLHYVREDFAGDLT